ncbi:short-chain dehydrogenase [Macrolepiota fuliginosa MF-IS2]|uniref:Short-chain dehydrogenase n=1 Tax=Macrolepiota fuliginosa MF-IS2 TaxID=1400762 RepID=A0A9P5XAA0_9AGAR|nr:short-chain dehydrogenase [Macrolepiota fuliginosa MF-IS2]
MSIKTMLGIVIDQFRTVPPVANVDLKGKVIIVIGANSGLGYEATKHFARMGAERVILACRSKQKGDTAVQRLEEETGCHNVECWSIDLSNFDSVRTFADRAIEKLGRIDVLLLNAAILSSPSGNYEATSDGYEIMLQVNALSHSLLGLLLVPKIIETSKKHSTTPRIVIVTSDLHFFTSFEDRIMDASNTFETLGSQGFCTPEKMEVRYHDTKLLNIFFIRALSERLKNQSVIVNCVNQGLWYSGVQRDIFEWILARSAEQGSRQLVYGAVGGSNDRELEKLKGAYINIAKVGKPSDFVLGENGKKRENKLWSDLIRALVKVDSRVKDVVQEYLTSA